MLNNDFVHKLYIGFIVLKLIEVEYKRLLTILIMI